MNKVQLAVKVLQFFKNDGRKTLYRTSAFDLIKFMLGLKGDHGIWCTEVLQEAVKHVPGAVYIGGRDNGRARVEFH